MIYNNLGVGLVCIAFSSNSKSIPSSFKGTLMILALLLKNPFKAPTKVGSSTIILSPASKKTFAAISNPSPEPEVTVMSSSFLTIKSFLFRNFFN